MRKPAVTHPYQCCSEIVYTQFPPCCCHLQRDEKIASFHETESGSSQPTIGSVETRSNRSNGKKPSKEQLERNTGQSQAKCNLRGKSVQRIVINGFHQKEPFNLKVSNDQGVQTSAGWFGAVLRTRGLDSSGGWWTLGVGINPETRELLIAISSLIRCGRVKQALSIIDNELAGGCYRQQRKGIPS